MAFVILKIAITFLYFVYSYELIFNMLKKYLVEDMGNK